ncbi:MAG TPA: VOC family protein [Haliangiales bacterium]|nr:VOC family protein [Haliangiales bacterium]
MLGTNPIIAFVATRAPDRAKAFYRDVLGLRLVADEDFALVFDAGGTMLRVAKVAEHTPAPFTVLGWRVTAIRPAVEQLGRRGVKLERFPGMQQDGAGIWTAPGGAMIAWFKDPDGNLLSLTQFA